MPRLLEARWVRDFVLWLRFSDGSEGEVDLSGELDGPIFEPLSDPGYFRQFTLSPDLHTVVWPNGADLAPRVPPRACPRSGGLNRISASPAPTGLESPRRSTCRRFNSRLPAT